MVAVIRLCEERAAMYGALRQSSLTAVALDRAANLLRQQAEARATSGAGEVYPANSSALERSIAELDAFERDCTILCEVENEVSFTESLALCLHELKRLRSASPTEAPGSEGAGDVPAQCPQCGVGGGGHEASCIYAPVAALGVRSAPTRLALNEQGEG
jgi:hypothetical protein